MTTKTRFSAAASVGSGVDNPQLKLSSEVTFQNTNGLTYKGRVVAIDPRPYEGYPRGRVRVKYNDWPQDRCVCVSHSILVYAVVQSVLIPYRDVTTASIVSGMEFAFPVYI